MKKILIVEDNDAYRTLLTEEVSKAGYDVTDTDSPIKGLEYVAKNKYDVVISDLNLPVLSGVDFTESVKTITPQAICIILTGDPDEHSELRSIKSNIDLYIEKNRSMFVILKYLDTLLRKRDGSSVDDFILYAKNENLVINATKHIVTKNDEVVNLTQTEYEILYLMLTNRNEILSREMIIDSLWREPALEVDPRVVDAHIKSLRSKLNLMSIVTVRGYGYRWNELGK